MTEAELMKKLIAFVGKKSVNKSAKMLGISQSYLYEILRGSRPVDNPAILKKFKIKKIVVLEQQ